MPTPAENFRVNLQGLKGAPSNKWGGPGGSPPGGGLGAEPPAYGGKLFHQNFNFLHKLVPFGVFESHENLAKKESCLQNGDTAVCAFITAFF